MRTLRRLGRTVIPLLAAWLFLSSCSLGASTQQSSGTLVMGLGTEPATLNPFEAADKSSVRALSPMFPNLYQLAPDLRVTPDLAAAMPQLSRDRKVWTVRLRHDARWSDGRPIIADDVVKTVEIQKDPNLDTDAAFDWSHLDRIDKIDDYTVRFTLNDVFAPFLALSLSTFVAPAHVYGRVPTHDMRATPLNAQPTVTGGPFRFVQRTLGREIDLAANPGYYAGLPRVARVVERIYSTPQAELDALKHGRVSWLPDLEPGEVNAAQALPRVSVHEFPALGQGYVDLRLNCRPGHLFSDVMVRQALAYALDKDQIVRQATRGAAVAVWGDILPTSWAYDSGALVKYPHDVSRARSLLQQAGWSPGPNGILSKAGKTFAASLYVRKDIPERVAAANLIATQARQVGMDLHVSQVQESDVYAPLRAGSYDIALASFSDSVDPDQYLVLHSSQLAPENNANGSNWTGYSSAELDRLIVAERTTLMDSQSSTMAARKRIFGKIERLLGQEIVQYFLWADYQTMAFDTHVNGLQPGPDGSFDYADLGHNVQVLKDWYLN